MQGLCVSCAILEQLRIISLCKPERRLVLPPKEENIGPARNSSHSRQGLRGQSGGGPLFGSSICPMQILPQAFPTTKDGISGNNYRVRFIINLVSNNEKKRKITVKNTVKIPNFCTFYS